MSYKQAVLRDDPISFWPLSGGSSLRTYATLLLEYPTYQDYFNNESTYLQEIGSISITDESNFGNHGAFTLGSPNFQDVTTLITYSSNDTNTSGCKINSNIGIDILNVYNVFQQGHEKQTFGIEFWLLMPGSSNTQSVIFDLHGVVTPGSSIQERLQIYAKEDFIYFKIYFSNGLSLVTKKQVYSWNTPINIFVSVKDKTMNIYVNGITDESISIPDNYQYYLDSKSIFNIGPTNSYFTINGLAFYDKILSSRQIINHMYWAERDSSPINYSNQTNVSNFALTTNSGKKIFSKKFVDTIGYNEGSLSNIVTDGAGITLAATSNSVAATGIWKYQLTTFSYLGYGGAEITWDSSSYESNSSGRYVIVEVSYDDGTTYYPVINGKKIPYFLSNFNSSFSAQCLIRVTLYSPDTSTGLQPRIDNLNINVYSSINEISDSGLFQISPVSNTSYTFKNDTTNIISRSRNLGINFSAQDPSDNPGYAIISSVTGSTYQAIEFWMEYNGAGSAVLDTNTGTIDLYIDSSNVLQNTISGSTLYINGINRNLSPVTLSNGEIYHVLLIYPFIKTSNIILNGSHDGSKTPSDASYGYITIYPSTLTSSQVLSRYKSFITVQTGTVKDQVTIIGTLQEYSGTSSQVNNGQPVIYHTHVG
jgi:hypothetical protein